MRMRCLFLFLFLALPLCAEVYSVWPFQRQPHAGQTPRPEDLFQAMKGTLFWREDLAVNGVRTEMRIAFSDLSLTEAASLLKREYPHGRFAANSNSLLAEYRSKEGRRTRLYLLQLKGMHQLVQFTMEIPKDGVRRNAVWPSSLPEIPGTSNLTVMQFFARNAVCVSFDMNGVSRPQALLDLGSRLKSAGWQTASGEISGIFTGSGDVFMKENPSELLIAGVTELENGRGIRATLYTRPLKK